MGSVRGQIGMAPLQWFKRERPARYAVDTRTCRRERDVAATAMYRMMDSGSGPLLARACVRKAEPPPPALVKTGEMVYRCSGTSFTHRGTF